MTTKRAYGFQFGAQQRPAARPTTPTPPKIGQPKKPLKPATPAMKGGPGGLKSKPAGGSADAATGATKVAFAQHTPPDVAKFLTKFAFGGGAGGLEGGGLGGLLSLPDRVLGNDIGMGVGNDRTRGLINKPTTPAQGGGLGGLLSLPNRVLGNDIGINNTRRAGEIGQQLRNVINPQPQGGGLGAMGKVPKTGGPAPRLSSPLQSVDMTHQGPMPEPPQINLEDLMMGGQQRPSIMDEIPSGADLMTPVRPTPMNQNRFKSQRLADQQWNQNYDKDYQTTAGRANNAIAQRGRSPLNPQSFGASFGGPVGFDPDAGFPRGEGPPGGGKPPIAGAPKIGNPPAAARVAPPVGGAPGGLPKPPAPPAGGIAKSSQVKLDLSDPKQFGKAAAMGCTVVNHSRGKMEKRAVGLGTLIGALGGGMMAPKGNRLEGAGRGGARGMGWDVGGGIGGGIGALSGASLGAMGGGALAMALGDKYPTNDGQALADLIAAMSAGGAGIGAGIGGLAGYGGGGYLGQRAVGDMLGEPNYEKDKKKPATAK